MAVEGYSNEDWMAAGPTLEGTYSPTQLFTAEDDIKTAAGTYATDQDIAVLTILARNADDELVPWDPPATADGVGGAVDQPEAGPAAKPVGVAAAGMEKIGRASCGERGCPEV